MKWCPGCQLSKPTSAFGKHAKRKDGLQVRCKDCRNAYLKEWYKQNKKLQVKRVAKSRTKRVLETYGLPAYKYEALLKKQGNACGACNKPFGNKTPHVDHDHVTNKVRGLLCMSCNTALGKFGDNVAGLQAAIDYLNAAE